MLKWRLGAVLALAALLGGCSMTDEGDGGPVAAAPDPDSIADAIPRADPKSRYGNPREYVVLGKRYRTLDSHEGYVARGMASWYGTKFHGRRTSSGEPYDMYAMTAAHKSLPLPCYVLVTNLDNGRRAVVRVNDRGPFHEGRIIDLSFLAAAKLDMLGRGTARVEVRALDPGQPIEP
ncbi:MAG: septal ring lytic transglycosylase RlpA family protein, partial [Gammaproteobacteria bacterium]|nr:septal ring lytic transglycosylase RlpA family protein [Gammaproteobacteria bacterium]